MKYRYLLLIAVFALTLDQQVFAFSKKPGFFGYSRGCLKAFDDSDYYDTWLCVWSIGIFSTFDMAISPTQTLGKLLDALEKDPKKAESDSASSSSSNKRKENEVPEERKPLARLSLFAQVADDAREYQISKTTTPLLSAAADYLTDGKDLNTASEQILNLETALLETLNKLEFLYE